MTDQSSDDVQREAERSRARVTSTLDELKERLTPGQIIDDLMSSSGGGASTFMSNLGSSLRDHPVPALLIGAGVLMFMASGDKASNGGGSSSVGDAVGSAAGAVSDRVKAGVAAVQDAVSSAGSTAGDLKDSVGHAAASASDRLHDLRGSGPAMALPKFLEDQPLVTGALGLALGALLGAALPTSDAEDALMGAQSDALKRTAAQAGKDAVHQVGEVATHVSKAASDEADRQGLTGDAGSLVNKIGAVGDKVAGALERELGTKSPSPTPGANRGTS